MVKQGKESNKAKTQIRQLILLTVLFLPLCFFIWFYASSLLVIPVKFILEALISFWQPDLFNGVSQYKYLLTVETLIFPSISFAGQGDKLAVLDVEINPMIYGYGIAVISALVMSLPNMTNSKKIIQIVIGYLIVVLIQVFGSFWQMLKHLILEAGPDAQAAIIETGISANFIALMYQLSYLILPSVVPVAYWIIINNDFIGRITGLKITTSRNFDTNDVSDRQE
ncbi:MAG: exosortase H-associated membrane protein [Marinicellaceae bacterium]